MTYSVFYQTIALDKFYSRDTILLIPVCVVIARRVTSDIARSRGLAVPHCKSTLLRPWILLGYELLNAHPGITVLEAKLLIYGNKLFCLCILTEGRAWIPILRTAVEEV